MPTEEQQIEEERRAQIAAVYEKYGADLLEAARNRLRESPNAEYDAEEAVQNAFIRVIEGQWPCPDSEEKLYAGFMIIVSDEAARLIQDQRGDAECCPLTEEICREGGCYADVTRQHQPELLLRAMMKLKERYRSVLILRCFRRLSVREISQRLDMKPKTVYTNLARGKEKLGNLLKKEALQCMVHPDE